MHRTATYKRITIAIIFLLYSLASFATGGDSSHRPAVPLPVTSTFTGFNVNTASNVNTTNRSFAQLDQYLNGQQFTVQQTGDEFNEAFFDKINAGDPTTEENKAKARSTLAEVENSNSYVDYLEPSDINKLPIGLRKKIGNTEVTIAISSAVFTEKYAKLTAFARIRIGQSPKELLFGVSGLKLSYKGGIIGDASLVLLGDVAIPINGDNAALILKGGMSMETGQANMLTYITVDCNGFKELGLNADIQFPRSMIVPADAQGTLLDGKVTAELRNVKVSNWNDIIASVSFTTPFQVNGLKGFNFTVSTAAFDFSDLRNNPDIVYPQGYQQKYLDQENINAWRGVYVKELNVGLPNAMKNRQEPDKVVSFGVNDLLIDNNRISGLFYAENVLPITKGSASGWKFSVDSIRLALEANHLMRAGFGGRIGLPMSKDYDTTNKRKFLAYSAVISSNSDYVCRVTTLDSLDFDIWKARVLLKPNSYIQLTGNGSSLKPEAMLHGKMGILAASTDEKPNRDAGKNPVADFKGISFESLHITTDAPYITAQYFGYDGEVKLGNFPVSINNISLEKDASTNEIGIGLGLRVNLHEAEFSGGTRVRIFGKLEEGEGLKSWSYSRLKIDEIDINARVKEVFRLEGRIKFLDDDPVYGDGFDGHIKVVIEKGLGPDSVSVAVNAIFGKKNTFRYWYIDGLVDLGSGIGGAVKITGFGGGAYYRMKKDGFSTSTDFSPTGVKYVPDSTAGLGFKATVLFSVGSKKVCKGGASFEVAFNAGGGVRYIGLFGFAKFLGEIPGAGNVTDFISKKFKAVEDKLNSVNLGSDALNNLKVMQPSSAAKETYPTEERPGETGLSAYIGIQYDFNAKSLHATFDLYVNAAGGLMKGAASENRAGWAVFHVDPKEWYLHMGTPSDRLGLKIGIAGISLTTGSYLMAGYNMPKFPDPPSKVISILRDAGVEYTNNINAGDAEGGRGFAFGTSLELNTGDVRFLFFYANFSAGLGFDVMIKDWGDAHCQGSSDRIGINGWYAQGQAYAYLQGELGVKIKILFIKKNISIIKGAAAALLQAKLPNPTWVGGYMGFTVNVLGGLIKGHFNFKFSFGHDCEIVRDEDIKEFDDFTVVSNITPDDGNTNVSVLSKVQVKFSIAPGKTMEAPREDGSGNDVFMPQLESVKLYDGNNEVANSTSFNVDGDVLTMIPSAVMRANTPYKVVTRVTMRQLVNGYWVPLSENGQVVTEEKTVTFTTGAAPETLPVEIVKRLYPFFGMKNLYVDENNKGRILLDRSFPDFFNKFAVWKMQVEDGNGTIINKADVSHNGNTDANLFTYNVPSGLQPGTTYKLKLMGEQPKVAGADPNKPQLELTFRTSAYKTLAAKFQSMKVTQTIVTKVSSDVIDMQAAVTPYEGFELYEITGTQYTGDNGMIEGVADVTNDAYYQNVIRPLIYPNLPEVPLKSADGTKSFTVTPGEATKYETPPLKAITPAWYYINMLQSNEYNEVLKTRMPFVHNMNKYINLQFIDLRLKVIRAYLGQKYGWWVISNDIGTIPPEFRTLCNLGFPFLLKGQYKVNFSLVQWDGTRSASSAFTYENPIE